MKRNKKVKISACLVIYNEEKVLQRCLSSIQNVVDEIIVVHDGKCTDKSLQIAKKFNAKIFVRKHVGEAEYHRPFAFSKATGDWIIHIDADEYLSDELKQAIPNLVQSKNVSAYAVKWPVWVAEDKSFITKGPYSKMLRSFLFRKSDLYMLGLTHFHPSTIGVEEKRNDLILYHKPKKSVFGKGEYKRKIHTWSEIRKSQAKNFTKLPYFGPKDYEDLVLFDIKNELRSPSKFMVLNIIRRLVWFLRLGGLWSNCINFKFLLLDLSHIYYKFSYTKK